MPVDSNWVYWQVTTRRDSWIDKLKHGTEPDVDGWVRLRGLSLPEAQHLLDWLDCRGVPNRELSFDPAAGFTVRWRPLNDSPGHAIP